MFLCFDYSALNGEYDAIDSTSFANSIGNRDNVSDSVVGTRVSNNNSISSVVGNNSALKSDISDPCSGRYIFMHNIPSRFNEDLLRNCELITRGTSKNICPYLVNLGFGPQIEDPSNVLLNSSWFMTNQFMLEVIFHNRMKNYACLTNDSSLASAVFVPFYAGLDMSRFLWGYNISARDSSAIALVKWLADRHEWSRMWGMDHFIVAGRISWDFRRQSDNESDWGSKLRFLPQSNNMSMLSIESSSWNNDYAIPYPTCFHPSKDIDIFQWQDRMRRQKRRYLFSFAGAPRPEYNNSIRGNLINQCLAAAEKQQCRLLDCNNGATNCDNPVNVMRVFQSSVFCLQPAGDSYTRRSVFGSILAGCIPVFFHPGTAYAQYIWHLPTNYTKYSVYIPVKDVSYMTTMNINETLLQIPESRVLALREEVLRLIPRIVYADPRYAGTMEEDAFDLAVNGILDRIQRVRDTIKEGKDPSIGFADRKSVV